MARITQQSSIHTTGVSYENEPIIKSDGAGEVMQWQPSDGAADGVFITETTGQAGLQLGVGVSPLTTGGDTTMVTVSGGDGSATTQSAGLYLQGKRTGTARYARIAGFHGADDTAFIDFYRDAADDAGAIRFGTQAAGGAVTDRLSISSAGAVSIPDTGSFTIGSLDIGHGLGGDINSVAVGKDALDGSDAGALGNTAIGSFALSGTLTATADYNVAIGYGCGDGITSGAENTAIGTAALSAAAVNHNVAVGRNALNLFAGSNATAVGSGAAASATSAGEPTAIGKSALSSLTTGGENTAVGQSALAGIQTAQNNVGVGNYAGFRMVGTSTTHGYANTFIGNRAAQNAATPNHCVAVGYNALGGATFTDNTQSGAISSGTTITMDGANADIVVGMRIFGAGIAEGTYITTVASSSANPQVFVINQAVASSVAGGTTLHFCKNQGDSNIATGSNSLAATTTGHSNVAIGHNAGTALTTGFKNVFVGYGAGKAANDDSYSVAIGYDALVADAASSGSIAIGYQALEGQNTASSNNVAIGFQAAKNLDGGTDSVYVGFLAGGKPSGTITGGFNTCLGYSAGYALTSGANNVLIGKNAGVAITDGPANVLIGASAGASMTTSDYNIAIGYQALDALTTNSHDNIAIGTNALSGQTLAAATSTTNSIAIGRDALGIQNNAAAINMAIGFNAGDAIVNGTQNVLIGHQAGSALADDSSNTAVGYNALTGSTAGGANTAIGSHAMDGALTGGNNTAVGASALGVAAAAMTDNTAIGVSALFNLNHADAINNVAVGANAGKQTTAGTPVAVDEASDSVFIGAATESAATDAENEIVIGYGGQGQGSNKITLGNASTNAIHCAVTTITSDSRVKRDVASSDIGLGFIEKLQSVTFKAVNPADYPDEIKENRLRDTTTEELVTPAVEAAEAVYETVVVQEARDAVAEETREEVHAAIEEVTEEVTIPAVAEIVGERHKHDEKEVSAEVEKVEMVKGEGDNYVRKVSTETVTRTERTPLYVDHPVVNEDGSPCVNADGEPVIHKCPVMESHVVQEAEAERKETRVVVKAADEWTETHIVTPAEQAREEVTERRLVSAAVEAKDAVYETVTVPADDRPADDDTVRLGLIAQDVQTAMTEAGVEFDIVNESPNGKLSLKYGNLVMPLIKAVQELSARVKTLEG